MKRKVYLQIVSGQKHTNYRRLILRNQLNISDWCITVCEQAITQPRELFKQEVGLDFERKKINNAFVLKCIFLGIFRRLIFELFILHSGVSDTFDHKNNPEL